MKATDGDCFAEAARGNIEILLLDPLSYFYSWAAQGDALVVRASEGQTRSSPEPGQPISEAAMTEGDTQTAEIEEAPTPAIDKVDIAPSQICGFGGLRCEEGGGMGPTFAV